MLLTCHDPLAASRSAAPAGQLADWGWGALDPGGGLRVVQDPLGDLVLAGPPDFVVVAQPGQDSIQDAGPGGMAGQAPVQGDDHHPAAGGAFGVADRVTYPTLARHPAAAELILNPSTDDFDDIDRLAEIVL
jgi:hypothetical protein